jgi:Arc/MetJ family transcription regulator
LEVYEMSTRTNIVLDDELVAQAMQRARVTTKKAAVEAALRAYVRQPDYAKLMELEGSRLVSDDYDPKALFTSEPAWGLAAREAAAPGYGKAPGGKPAARKTAKR